MRTKGSSSSVRVKRRPLVLKPYDPDVHPNIGVKLDDEAGKPGEAGKPTAEPKRPQRPIVTIVRVPTPEPPRPAAAEEEEEDGVVKDDQPEKGLMSAKDVLFFRGGIIVNPYLDADIRAQFIFDIQAPDTKSLREAVKRAVSEKWELSENAIEKCDVLHPRTPYWLMVRFVVERLVWQIKDGVSPVYVSIPPVRGDFSNPLLEPRWCYPEARTVVSRAERRSMAYHCLQYALESGLGLTVLNETPDHLLMGFTWLSDPE